MDEATREALELFVEKARELAGCRYVQWLNANRGTTLHIGSQHGGGLAIQHMHPDRDATQALVLTFRFFIQDNEHSSFRWLANNAANDPGVSVQWKHRFAKIRDELNAWLNSPSSLTTQHLKESESRGLPVVEEHDFTKREIMDVFIYGDFAHANREKKKVFDRWKADRVWFEMAQAEFDFVLMGVLPAIWHVARLSERELAIQTNSVGALTPPDSQPGEDYSRFQDG